MASYKLDTHASRVHIYTFTEGFFAKFAHDLALATVPTGKGETRPDGSAHVELRFEVPFITVIGVRKKDFVDAEVLTVEDCEDIQRRIQNEFFPKSGSNHAIEVSGDLKEKRATLTLTIPSGKSFPLNADVRPGIGDETALITGMCPISLSGLGIGPIKGPLGAFKVKDVVHVDFHTVFRAD